MTSIQELVQNRVGVTCGRILYCMLRLSPGLPIIRLPGGTRIRRARLGSGASKTLSVEDRARDGGGPSTQGGGSCDELEELGCCGGGMLGGLGLGRIVRSSCRLVLTAGDIGNSFRNALCRSCS